MWLKQHSDSLHTIDRLDCNDNIPGLIVGLFLPMYGPDRLVIHLTQCTYQLDRHWTKVEGWQLAVALVKTKMSISKGFVGKMCVRKMSEYHVIILSCKRFVLSLIARGDFL